MITAHPYNMWPLHVKFFTNVSKEAWDEAIVAQPLPVGMTFTEEYEGVDGRSGFPGSGRAGPIDITDGKSLPTTRLVSLRSVQARFLLSTRRNIPRLEPSSPTPGV